MNRARPAIILSMLLLFTLLLGAAGVQAQSPAPGGTLVGPAFTYQGQLKKAGKAYDGACDFQFSLYDVASGGNQIGALLTQNQIRVSKGIFAVKLDFGASVFTGDARWLQVAVKCPGDEGFVIFSTRQVLTPTPYAIGLVPGAVVSGDKVDSITGRSVTGRGLAGFSDTWQGVYGFSRDQAGIVGESNGFDGVYGVTTKPGFAGVSGRNETDGGGFGVWGFSKAGIGVHGIGGNDRSTGVLGFSEQGTGVTGVTRVDNRAAVFGSNEAGGAGVFGLSQRGDGIYGEAHQDDKRGVFGNNLAGGTGVHGLSARGDGMVGITNSADKAGVVGFAVQGTGVTGITRNTGRAGIFGSNEAGGSGVVGISAQGDGVWGSAKVDNKSGVVGINEAGGAGVYGWSKFGYAGNFNGKVIVKTLEIAGGADFAEPFDVRGDSNASIAPGMVVCIDAAHPGKLVVCANAYDRTVAGVISGAGGIQPGMLMRQDGSQASGQHPVALTGRVYVWADATQQPIHPGDLLTTSATAGYAAKASDHDRAQGAIIGKAMGALERGKGLVLVLVGLN